MIDCRSCHHWVVFEHQLHGVLVRVDGEVKVVPPPPPEVIKTCDQGLSPVEGGKTVGHEVLRCKGYRVRGWL